MSLFFTCFRYDKMDPLDVDIKEEPIDTGDDTNISDLHHSGQSTSKVLVEDNGVWIMSKESNQEHRFQCNICRVTFASKDSLTSHIESAHETNKFKCDNCTCAFRWKHNLKEHIREVHQSQSGHYCKICQKAFIFG